MDDGKYERGYHEFFCPICRATIARKLFYREYEKNSVDYVKSESEKQELYECFIIEHFKDIHGVDLTERNNNDA